METPEGPDPQSTVGLTVHAAMGAIERHNLAHADVLPPRLRPPTLDKQSLPGWPRLVDLVSNIPVGNVHAHSRDALRRVHGYLSPRSSPAPSGTSAEFHSLRCVSERWST